MIEISVITAVRNGATTIRHCIGSVLSQSCSAEHIIIDGGSTDGTLSIVRETAPDARVVSEPDNGIYDAMNKGIALATGDVVGILNADDFYAHRDVLARVAAMFADRSVDSCYGDLVYVREAASGSGGEDGGKSFDVIRYWKSGHFDPANFYRGWMPPHPAFFVRRQAYEKYGPFRLDFGSAADYELMLRFLLKNGISAAYIPEVLVIMRSGGISNASLKNRIRANRMDRRAWRVNGLKPRPWTLLMKPLGKLGQWIL